MEGIEIRALTSLDELAAVEALQRSVWDAPSAVIYLHMLVSLVRNGGSVIGAVKEGQVIGAVISYLGLESPEANRPAMANLKLVSQRMAVLPEYRNVGLGFELKLAQRQYAIRQGIRLITWTFDPLFSRNAHLNIRKLGAVSQEYIRDYYGTQTSPLVRAKSSDRLLAEWWVTNKRVEQRLYGRRSGLTVPQYLEGNAPILNPSRLGSWGVPIPSESVRQPENTMVLVEIPDDYEQIMRTDEGLAQAWRVHSREALETAIFAGYMITDFVHGAHEGYERSFYVLSYAEYSDIEINQFSNN